MPHVSQAVRIRILNDNLRVQYQNDNGEFTGAGELCYAFALVYLNMYNDKPKWETIHQIRKVSRKPFTSDATVNLVARNGSMFQHDDIEVAADLAFFEFYRVVIAVHEDVKIAENGNAFEGAKTPKLVKGNKSEVKGYLKV